MAVDKKVVLFGRTGAGKSTIANALVTGGIENVLFKSSDGAKGCTSEIQKEKGRGWVVTDTPGLGEAEVGTVSNTEAKQMLTDFLKNVKDKYSHIIYVQRAGRMTEMDEMIWLIFSSIFQGAENAFVVLFTKADETWLEENRQKLPAYLRDQTILVTDIPPIPRNLRPVAERREKAIREISIQNLEAELIELFQQRKNKYSTPGIDEMTDEQLEDKSWSLLKYVVENIKRLFKETEWKSVASKLAKVVSVANFILDVVSLAGV